MKSRKNTINGKVIVTGDVNELEPNEVLINEKLNEDGTVSLDIKTLDNKIKDNNSEQGQILSRMRILGISNVSEVYVWNGVIMDSFLIPLEAGDYTYDKENNILKCNLFNGTFYVSYISNVKTSTLLTYKLKDDDNIVVETKFDGSNLINPNTSTNIQSDRITNPHPDTFDEVSCSILDYETKKELFKVVLR